MPDERVSQPLDVWQFQEATLPDKFEGYLDRSRYSVIKTLRGLSQADEDVQGAMRDLVVLANPGFTMQYEGGTRAQANAERVTNQLLERVYGQGGGIDGLVNNQIQEVYLTGVSSLEWFPMPSRREVLDVAIVPAEQIDIKYNQEEGYKYYQRHAIMNNESLNLRTYIYNAHQTSGDSPYGIPVAISAIHSLQEKYNLLKDYEAIRKKLKRGAFVMLTLPKPQPHEVGAESLASDKYQENLAKHVTSAVTLALKGAENGMMVSLEGSEAQAISVDENTSGFGDLNLSNQLRVWSALATLPFMRGHMDSTTEALAKVVYPILLATAKNMRITVKRSIEFGLNLHLQLNGIPAQVEMVFEEPSNPFELEHEQALETEAARDTTLSKLLGRGYLEKVADKHDVEAPDEAEVTADDDGDDADTDDEIDDADTS